jgi:hypothetical protein
LNEDMSVRERRPDGIHRAHEMRVQVAAGRPLGDACPANRDDDENDGLKPLLLHQFGPDQGPDVSAIAAGAQQGIGCRVAAAPDIGYRFKPIGGLARRPSATNGESTLRGNEESACAHKLDTTSTLQPYNPPT